jgi:hypothetical protein
VYGMEGSAGTLTELEVMLVPTEGAKGVLEPMEG